MSISECFENGCYEWVDGRHCFCEVHEKEQIEKIKRVDDFSSRMGVDKAKVDSVYRA